MFLEIIIGSALAAAALAFWLRKQAAKIPLSKAQLPAEIISGINAEEHRQILERGKSIVRSIGERSLKIPDPSMARLIADLGITAQKIYKNLKEDPKDLFVARNFVDYHAPKCVEILDEYLRVNQQAPSPDRDKTLADTQAVLREMKTTFDTFLAKCLENDLDGLAVLAETVRRVDQVERPVLLNAALQPAINQKDRP